MRNCIIGRPTCHATKAQLFFSSSSSSSSRRIIATKNTNRYSHYYLAPSSTTSFSTTIATTRTKTYAHNRSILPFRTLAATTTPSNLLLRQPPSPYKTSSSSCLSMSYSTTTAAAATKTTTATTSPLVEVREYTLHPEHATTFLKVTTESASLRTSYLPMVWYSLPEVGPLHVATHVYYYAGGYAERSQKRKLLAQQEEWKSYIASCRQCVQSQQSTLWVEAPFLQRTFSSELENNTVRGMSRLLQDPPTRDSSSGSSSTTTTTTPILEYRRYQLQLGYDTVPKFLDFYEAGLPSKLATLAEKSSLITVLYSEVGSLNQVWEIWYHGQGYAGMEQSRQQARQAHPWRDAIAQIAPLAVSFSTSIHIPTSFSPLR